jgi:hypothetical protein
VTVPGAGQEPNPQAGQEPGGSTPPNAQPQMPPAAGQEPAAGAQPESFSREYVETLRREAADFRKRATTAEGKVQQHEREQLSETERLTAELNDTKTKATELEQRYQNALIQTAIEREAMKLGAIDPDVVFALVDRTSIKFDDEGHVTGADSAVKALLKDKPYLVKSENGNGGTRSVPATGKPGPPAGRSEDVAARVEKLKASGAYSRF